MRETRADPSFYCLMNGLAEYLRSTPILTEVSLPTIAKLDQ